MRGNTRALIGALAAALAAAALGLAAAGAQAEVIYDNIPSPLPGNVPSYGFEAYSLSEFGGEVTFTVPSGQKHPQITFLMSTWACQEGTWYEGNCLTTKKHGFAGPITMIIRDTMGNVIHTYTKRVKMPYRPSASPICATPEFESPGSWYDAAENRCYHGLAFELTLKFPKKDPLPGKGAIITIQYNTSHHGPNPGTGGVYYDSLNVGMVGSPPSVGSDPTEEVFLNSTWSAMYCGEESRIGKFEGVLCPSLFEGEQPGIKIAATK